MSEELEAAFAVEQAQWVDVEDSLVARWRELEDAMAYGRSQHQATMLDVQRQWENNRGVCNQVEEDRKEAERVLKRAKCLD